MFSVQHHLVLLVFLWFYYFTAVFFYLLVSIKLLSMKQNLRFCHLVCVCYVLSRSQHFTENMEPDQLPWQHCRNR